MDFITFKVKHNTDSVLLELFGAEQDMGGRAQVRALNKMIDEVKVQGSRSVRDAGYNLKVADIKRGIRVRYAAAGRLRAEAVASGRPIPLINYGARQTSRGVSVNVKSGRKLIAGAFIATMPSGHRGVFVRQEGAKHRKIINARKPGWHSLGIRELYGPSIPDGLANAAVAEQLQRLVIDRYPVLLEREVQWLQRRKPGA